MSEPAKVLGIDLGTTYSCMAVVDEYGKAVVLKNFDGYSITPSAVFFESPENIIVGEVAKAEAPLSPDRVETFIKRKMGSPLISRFFDQDYTPEQLSAMILKRLAQDAETALGAPIRDVVITCPAYFGINEREATRRAGEIAGLNVLQILNEPTAAAICYGLTDSSEGKVVLIYDLGGGTFDVTIIEIQPASIRVICTGGDKSLGGKNWDEALINHFVHEFCQAQGAEPDELKTNPETLKELYLLAEKAKKDLTSRDKTGLNISHDGQRQRLELTRAQFEDLTGGLLEQTLTLTRELLAEAKAKGHEHFDELLMVGGSTRMPQVKQALLTAFGKEPRLFDPDEAVAKGAALYGAKLRLDDELIRRVQAALGQEAPAAGDAAFTLASAPAAVVEQVAAQLASETGLTLAAVKNTKRIVNVSSHSFGIVAHDAANREIVAHLVLRNDEVPYERTETFGTQEANQANVQLQIVEDELAERSLPHPHPAVSLIGDAVLHLPAGLPQHAPIEISFRLNEEGRLEIQAVEKSSGRSIATEIKTTSVISREDAEAARKVLAAMAVS